MKNFRSVKPEAASLLGAPLSESDALEHILQSQCQALSLAITRLEGIGKHDALILLRSSLSHPKLVHTLRCFPCVDHPLLKNFDSLLRHGLESIFNLSLSDSQWMQASLPVMAGGLIWHSPSYLTSTTRLFGFGCRYSVSPILHAQQVAST